MTMTDHLTTSDLSLVTFDLYRDIHKGIRAELFAVTGAAGAVDPGDRFAVAALADHVTSVAGLLEDHAAHEDDAIDPVLEIHAPDLAERISSDHVVLERSMASIVDMARSALDSPSVDLTRMCHGVYLGLARFVADYLEHQDVEERVVMPALERAVGVEGVVAIHQAIVTSIPPETMARSLALMLPAMNIENQCEMLGGMRASAPPEVFSGVVGLAQSVLRPADFAELARRLDV